MLNSLGVRQQVPVILGVVPGAQNFVTGESLDGRLVLPPTERDNLGPLQIEISSRNHGTKVSICTSVFGDSSRCYLVHILSFQGATYFRAPLSQNSHVRSLYWIGLFATAPPIRSP